MRLDQGIKLYLLRHKLIKSKQIIGTQFYIFSTLLLVLQKNYMFYLGINYKSQIHN